MEKFVIYVATFLLSVMLIHVFRNQAARIGLVDYPCDRKRHCGEVPLVGGVSIFVAFAAAVLIFNVGSPNIGALIAGSLIVVTVGVMDDIKALKSHPKFLAQIVAATLMCLWGGVVLRDLGALSFDNSLFTLGSLAVPFTVFATVGVINAINMSDGLDGLSGSITLVALMGLGITTYVSGAIVEFSTLMVLLSAVVAFLAFNVRFPGRVRALVFLGDAGSMFIGFALTWFVVSLSQGEQRIMAPVTALWFLAVPLFDTVGIMLRRLLKGRSPFRADREHFHHAFQLAGFSVFQTQMTITALAVVCMGIGLAGQFAGAPEIVMFYLFLGVFGLYFWGMMRAWKVMRFLRRTMHHEKQAEPEVVIQHDVIADAQLTESADQVLRGVGVGPGDNAVESIVRSSKSSSHSVEKVPLKLIVNSKLAKDSKTSSHTVDKK